MTNAETQLQDALRSAEPVTLSLAEIGARGLLETLAADGGSYSVRVESLIARIEIEMGNGLVVGARAQRDGGTVEGREAYVLLRRIRSGTAEVTPKRFLSMANVLEPIAALPDLGLLSSRPPVGESDTIELELPEARPPVPPPAQVTEEIDLPPELLAPRPPVRVIAPPAIAPAVIAPAVVAPAIAPPPLRRRAPAPAAKPSRRGWAIAAAMLLAVSGLATVAVAALGAREPEIATPAPIEAPRVIEAPAPVAADEDAADEEPAEEVSHVEARTLAREARSLLRQGRPRAALWRARRAAQLRRGVPYYQLVLGDALAANGQEPAARRAWRRALRLRPSYRAAAARLESARSSS